MQMYSSSFRFLSGIVILSSWLANAQAPQIRTSKSVYAPGEAITVTFQNGPGNAKDWIGIYLQGTKPGTVPAPLWFYVNGTRNATMGLASGSVTFATGLSATGTYEVHLLRDDGYVIVASTAFDVGTPPPATVKPVTSRSWEVPHFVHNHDARFNNKARISGDGRKLVLVRQPSSKVSGYALTTWLGGLGKVAPGTADLPEVFLYDLDTGALKSIFVGVQETRQDSSGNHYMTQLYDTVTADLNHDGSRAVVTYTDHRMSYSTDGVAQSLLVDSVIKLIDTHTGVTLFETRLPTGIGPEGPAIRLNQDGTRAVFLHHPRSAASSVTFGVTYFDEAPVQIYSLVLSGNAPPLKLSEGDGQTAPKLHDFSHWQAAQFQFDLDAAGNRVVFNYAEPAQVIGINFDGAGRHVISTKTDAPYVALSRDGEHVVYSFYGDKTPDDDNASFVNTFAGTVERPLIRREVDGSRFSNAAQFVPGDDANELAYSSRQEGGYYRPAENQPAIDVNWWGGTLVDASDDLKVVLTQSVPVGGSQFAPERTYYLSRFEDDEDRDGLGDHWERSHFGSLAEGARGDNDGDSFRNDAEYQLGTNPKNQDSDGDGLDDATEFNRTGTNPSDSGSRLAVETVRQADGKLRLNWNTVSGKSYRIQSNFDLGPAHAWLNASESFKGDGKPAELSVAPPTQSRAVFYRLILE